MRNSLNLASLGLLRQGAARALNTATDGLIRLSGDVQNPVVPGVGHKGPATFEDPFRRNKERAKELLRVNNEALVLLLTT